MSGNYDYSRDALTALQQNKDKYGLDYSLVENPGLREWSSGQVPVYDGQVFTLMAGGKPVYQGVGAEGLAEATRLSSNLGGGWQINGSLPENTVQWNEEWFSKGKGKGQSKADIAQTNGLTYASKEASDFDPAIFLGALPFAAALAAPALGAALGGSGGAGASAGLAANSLGGGLASGAASSLGAGLAGGAGLGAGLTAALPTDIVVTGATGAGLGAGSAAGLAGAAGAGAGAALGGGPGASGFDGITVTGSPTSPLDFSGLGIDFGGLSGMAASFPGGGSGGAAPEAVDPNEIVVEGQTQPPPALDFGLPVDLAALAAAGAIPLTAAPPVTQAPPKSLLDKIADYAQIAGLGVGLLGNAFGGGGGSGNGTIPGGLGVDLQDIFKAQLPGPTIPGAGARTARQMPAQDWTRYAMRPEQSQFAHVPQGYVPPAPGQRDPRWDRENFAVGGMG